MHGTVLFITVAMLVAAADSFRLGQPPELAVDRNVAGPSRWS